MLFRHLFVLLFTCSFLPLGVAQEIVSEPTHALYEAVVFPDRSLTRRFEQAARLFETGRSSEAAVMLGGILENADVTFFQPEESAEEPPRRTLRLTVQDYVINRIRNLPREARESYAFQFEPTARRLLDSAAAAGSLDDVHQVARKYFPTASGASAAFLVALTQFERGDYVAAFLTLDRLKRLHPSLPDTLQPALEQMLEELQTRLQNNPLPQNISESLWLEQTGWRLPMGTPAQNAGTQATAPLLEQNWTVPLFTRLFNERETERLSQLLESGDDLYIPASQPLLVGDLFITRTFGETIAVDTNTGKRLWAASESEYRLPERLSIAPFHSHVNSRSALRFFFWHNRIAQQLSSDGERLFAIDGHDFQIEHRQFARLPVNIGGGEDPRFSPGNTLTARDVRAGRILWQIGKFPFVQKYFDTLFASSRQPREERFEFDDTVFTDDEQLLRDTWFLGAPLPLHGRLYVIGETDGTFQLFVLESHSGRLIARQTFAHAQSPMSANIVRRSYPLFPSASGGIVICPTGNGLIAALDAVTLSPIWCFTYAPAQAAASANRMIQNQQRIAPIPQVNEHSVRHLFAASGWQVPRMIIDGQRVLVAPPDRAALYCLDLLSGELLWEQTVSRPNALYVACVHENKAFVATPINLMVFDMDSGKEVASHKIRFPFALQPAGVGVHSGNQYFIPFTEGQLAVVDLNEGTMTWLDASGLAILPPVVEEIPDSEMTDDPTATLLLSGAFGGQHEGESDVFIPDLVADGIFRTPIRFGNLVGIRGRFFSQSPTQISSFDQKEPLRQQAEILLHADPYDSQGLLQQGRIFRTEGKLAEAIDSFRASMRSNPTPEAADALRRNLLEATRNDYPAWADAGQELESLAEFSDEWGMILYAQIEGILQSGTMDNLLPVLEKIFALGHYPSILIPVSSDHSAQLHRALGGLIDQNIIRGNRPALRAAWEELAETLFQRLVTNPEGFTKPPHISALPPQWLQNTVHLPPEIQRWSIFVQIFRNTDAAEKAKQILREAYIRYRLPIALDLQERLSAVPRWSELSIPFVWNSGIVDVQDIPASSAGTRRNESNPIDRNINRLLDAARNPHAASRSLGSQQTLPLGGFPNPELAAFNFAVTPWSVQATEYFLYCNDLSGQELWRLALPHTKYPETRMANTQAGDHVLYIQAHQNLFILVQGNLMTAIDVASQSDAKILWSKTLSTSLVNKQHSRDRIPDQRLAIHGAFPRKSVFVSPHVIAVWDAHHVYGFEPLTGHTLWVRKILHDKCSILGDNENLFLVFPDARQVLAIDSSSGGEIDTAPLPDGAAYYVYGTNIVFARRLAETNDRWQNYSLHVCDLRDMHDKRARALLIVNSPDEQLISPIPSEILHDRLNHRITFVQMLHDDRFLSVANWGTKSLQIHDLQKKEKLLPEGNSVLRFVSEGHTGETMRCDVEFVEDRILVLFTQDVSMRPMGPWEAGNLPFQRVTYSQVSGVSGISVGKGEMMLFDTAGNPCWSQPTNIETIQRLWDVPARLPVMLFAVSTTVRGTTQLVRDSHATHLMAVDKRSGEFRFRKRFGENERPFLQGFRITADPSAQAITFAVPFSHPPEIVRAVFTDAAE